MKIFPKKTAFLLIVIISIFTACSSTGGVGNNSSNQISAANNENANQNLTKDDAVELARIIKLPFQPEEVSWREDAAKAPDNSSGKKLTVVFKFTRDDAQNLIAQAEKHKAPVGAQVEPETWFPAELIASSELSGNETIKGNAYAVNDFLQEPYKNGKLTHLPGTDYFVLELTSF